MHAGTRSSSPELHTWTVARPEVAQRPGDPVVSVDTCFTTYRSPSITTRSKVAPDFESAASIGMRDVAPASSSSTEPATTGRRPLRSARSAARARRSARMLAARVAARRPTSPTSTHVPQRADALQHDGGRGRADAGVRDDVGRGPDRRRRREPAVLHRELARRGCRAPASSVPLIAATMRVGLVAAAVRPVAGVVVAGPSAGGVGRRARGRGRVVRASTWWCESTSRGRARACSDALPSRRRRRRRGRAHDAEQRPRASDRGPGHGGLQRDRVQHAARPSRDAVHHPDRPG